MLGEVSGRSRGVGVRGPFGAPKVHYILDEHPLSLRSISIETTSYSNARTHRDGSPRTSVRSACAESFATVILPTHRTTPATASNANNTV